MKLPESTSRSLKKMDTTTSDGSDCSQTEGQGSLLCPSFAVGAARSGRRGLLFRKETSESLALDHNV